MNINDVQESTNPFVFGVNQMTLAEFEVEDGQYGKQFKFTFTKEGVTKQNGDPVTQVCWIPLSKAFTSDKAWMFLKKLRQFVDVLAAKNPNAQEVYDSIKKNAPNFDESDVESVQKFEANFVTKLLEGVKGTEMNVLLHYKGKYLNIPTYKENGYELQFGANPTQSAGLNSVKSVPTETVENAAEAAPNVEDDGWN